FMIYCETQNEIDYYWESLSAVPEAEQCGWLKDKYGVSWQVVHRDMDKMLQSGSPRQVMALTQMILKMKKLDIARLYDCFKTA
ncbi:MAG: VOC family protein, partial [Candidatus Caldarchaeum sp.]